MKIRPVLVALLCATVACVALYHHVPLEATMNSLHVPMQLSKNLIKVGTALLFMEFARLMIIAFYKPQGGLRRDNFTAGIGHLTKVVYAISLLVLLLSLFEVSIQEAITSLSLIAAAIVLMTKDYISNLINGMYITFTKLVNIGDNVKIDENKGKILDITLTNVHLLNEDDDIIYIPNNIVFSGEIINFTRRELKKSYVDFEIRSEYLIKPVELEKAIIDSLGDLHELIQPQSFDLKIASIKHTHTAYKFQFVLRDPLNKEQDRKVKRHIVRFVLTTLAERSASHQMPVNPTHPA